MAGPPENSGGPVFYKRGRYPVVLRTVLVNVVILLLFSLGCGNDPNGSSVKSTIAQTSETEKVEAKSSKVAGVDIHSADSVSETITILEGSFARYKIGEVLTRYPNPIVAIGESDEVSGVVVFDENGEVLSGTIAVDVSVLKSDKSKRDNWIRRSGGIGAEITLNVTEIEGLTFPLDKLGEIEFVIVGDLEISGTTVTTRWDASATLSESNVEGKADTSISWDQFGLSKPSLPFIISVEDEITLELEFKASRN
jgi:polyisoprenoid-binding protein YceI